MKSVFFHMQGYRDLPDEFFDQEESIWVTPSSDKYCDPVQVGEYLHDNLDELEYAIDLGFDGVGVNEHHQNGYDLSVAPAMAAYAVARKKSNAAICMMGATVPTHPPLRIAEELAMVDCISGGRLVAGMPVGTAMDTVGASGIPPTQVRPRYYEGLDLIKQAWAKDGPFEFNGKYTQLRYVNPWPKPIQKPHPPIWLGGGGSLETFQFAVDNNYAYNYLGLGGIAPAITQMKIFWDLVEKAGLDDNPYRAGYSTYIAVADTDAEARKLYAKHVERSFKMNAHIPLHLAAIPGYMSKPSLQALLKRSGGEADPFKVKVEPDYDYLVESGSIIAGSPDTVAEKLIEMATTMRFGHLIAILQLITLPTELARYSMKLYAEEVMPRVSKVWEGQGYEDHWWPEAAKKTNSVEQLDPAVELAVR